MTRRVLLGLALALGALVLPAQGLAAGATPSEKELAERYAPVVRLVEQAEECGPGEPYEPIDVDLILDEPTIALRGPWNSTDLVKIGPVADDLAGRYEYHLDFPGNALAPGCDYETWARRLKAKGGEPTVYAHLATEEGQPDRLALQYWFFYPFNDFNNKHEGDWEMIQLVFDAATPEQALGAEPVEVGYSSHEGAERAAWDDEKLEKVDGTHPVVYPAAGSHANKFTEALYVGSSADAGVGCDDTRGPHRELQPVVRVLPNDPAAGRAEYPWLAFEGRWGELQPAFYNGPTGPNLKTQWNEPLTWAEGWRDRSYAVPTASIFGTGATDTFCSGVERGSEALLRLLRAPGPTLLFLAILVTLLVALAVKATWTPVAPLRIGHRRAWGQILSACGRMYLRQPRLVLGAGVLFLPLVVVVTVLQWSLVRAADAFGSVTGQGAGLLAYVALMIGTTLTLFGLALLQGAIACALAELDGGRTIGPLGAYRLALRRVRPLLGGTAVFVVAWILLTSTVLLIPVAIWLAVRWSLLAPVAELEGASSLAALRRSADLVRGRWLKVGTLVGLGGLIALAAGPLIGALLIFVSASSLALLNLVAGVVYVFALPFVALVTTYVYADARARGELEPRVVVDELPAEISLG